MSPLSYHAFSLEATYFELFPNFLCSNPSFSILFVYGLMPFYSLLLLSKIMNEWMNEYCNAMTAAATKTKPSRWFLQAITIASTESPKLNLTSSTHKCILNIIIISTYTLTGTFIAESQKVLKAFLLPLKQYFTSLTGTPTTFTIFPTQYLHCFLKHRRWPHSSFASFPGFKPSSYRRWKPLRAFDFSCLCNIATVSNSCWAHVRDKEVNIYQSLH